MAHIMTMPREYANDAEFRLDEQKLGQQGWSVDTTGASVDTSQSLLQRIKGRFAPAKPGPIVVIYSRPKPS